MLLVGPTELHNQDQPRSQVRSCFTLTWECGHLPIVVLFWRKSVAEDPLLIPSYVARWRSVLFPLSRPGRRADEEEAVWISDAQTKQSIVVLCSGTWGTECMVMHWRSTLYKILFLTLINYMLITISIAWSVGTSTDQFSSILQFSSHCSRSWKPISWKYEMLWVSLHPRHQLKWFDRSTWSVLPTAVLPKRRCRL